MAISVIILAAGKGTRMKSKIPKVLHEVAARPMIEHVYHTAQQLDAEEIVIVYGHGGEKVREKCSEFNAIWIEQEQQLGTGHAVAQAISSVNPDNTVLILYADVPLITAETLQLLIKNAADGVGLLTVVLNKPFGYGRIIRNEQGQVQAIAEQKDASPEQQDINEVNSGILCCKGRMLKGLLDQIDNNNSQGEYYLTDIFSLAVNQGEVIKTTQAEKSYEVEGVNNRVQLAELERIYQRNQATKFMNAGVTIADPARIDCRGDIKIEQDVFIDVNVILEGQVELGENVHVGANSIIINSKIAKDVRIEANSIIENSVINSKCTIGPFARIRPETELAEGVKIGNFVEVKKSRIGKNSKVNHLSYIGDTEMGSNVNVGAGTITCNYDGANKHKTIIGNDVFVGSDTQLVAPVKIADGITIGAGTTITKDVDGEGLVISRVVQKSYKGWKRPVKDKS